MNSDQEGGSVFLFWSSWIAAIFRNTLLKLVQKNRKRKKKSFHFFDLFYLRVRLHRTNDQSMPVLSEQKKIKDFQHVLLLGLEDTEQKGYAHH